MTEDGNRSNPEEIQQELELHRVAYEDANDGLGLLLALEFCAQHNISVPDWAKRGLSRALRNYMRGNVREIGEALNIERPKSWRRNTDPMAQLPFWSDIFAQAIEMRGKGYPLDNEFFEKVGEIYHVSRAKAADIYYDQLRFRVEYLFHEALENGDLPSNLNKKDFHTHLYQETNQWLSSMFQVTPPRGEFVSLQFFSNLGHLYDEYRRRVFGSG